MTTYGPWEKSLCESCGLSFQVARACPVTIEGDLKCGDCRIKESAYCDGYSAGYSKASNKQGEQEMSDLCNYSNQDIDEMIVNNPDLMKSLRAVIKAGDLKTIGESSEGANKWNRHVMAFVYDQLVGMAKSEIEAIS